MTTPDFERIGRYALIRKLATGGMADVYLARVEGPGGFEKQVVLKRILPELARNPAFVEMFLREARLAATFEHPNLAHVFDFGSEGDAYYLTMEYVDGPTLRQVRRRAETQGWQLPVDAVALMIAKACEGLHYVHELRDPRTDEPMGLVHRDVSPDNLIVSRKGNVKVLDFGIAKDPNVESTTRSGTVRGKLHYMAPEQLSEQPLDRRVDVWALGVVLFELLTLKKPYLGTADAAVMKAILFDPLIPVQRLRPDVPDALAHIIDKALAKDRDQRLGSAQELQYALEEFVSASGQRLGSYDLAMMVNDLVEGRAPRSGQSTLRTPRLSFEDLRAVATPTSARPTTPARPAPLESPPGASSEAAESPKTATEEATKRSTTESAKGGSTQTTTAETTPAAPSVRPPPAGVPSTSRRWGPGLLAAVLFAIIASALVGRPLLRSSAPAITSASVDQPAPVVTAPVDRPPPVVTPTADQPAPARPPEVVADSAVHTPPPVLVDAPLEPARVEDARPKPGKTPPRSIKRSSLEVRVLPEGSVEMDGAAPPAMVVMGPHTFTFSNRRFGTISKPVEVNSCAGRIIVGYSFQSDKLTVSCRDQ